MYTKSSLTYKIGKALQLSLFSILFLSLNNCKNREEEPKITDCGCDSQVIRTIPESLNLVGEIYFEVNLYDSNPTIKKCWIKYVEPNCINCIDYMIVCNENILPQQVLNLRNNGGKLNVKFAGNLHKICGEFASPADETYNNITLTKIQVQ